ncbi:hypothetical protein ACFVFS_35900 [Kitasatospora sp. NPDC057692]|uniref:hypothetical protein n=1 Tax=Kitasatospora sp. NPDC057692 TaxID=3346215 RepID=UPI0036BBCBF1
MILDGPPATAPRMLLLDRVDFTSGCRVFDLVRPVFLMPGDRIRVALDEVTVRRAATGREERLQGSMNSVLRRQRYR